MTFVRVLHLEDSELDAELIRQRLEKSSLAVSIEWVVDRANFIAKLESSAYDVILSDYQLPTIKGLEALELAQQIQPDTPFIFISGAMGEEFAIDTLKQGATDYVLKERLARLVPAVERALKDHQQRAARRAAEIASREIEDRLRFAHEAAKLGSWELDLTTGEMICSALCKQNLGLPPDAQVSHRKLMSLIHSEDLARVQRAIEQSVADDTQPYDIEYRIVLSDQSIRWLHVRGQLVRGEGQKPPRMTGVSLDVTSRKAAELAAEQTEAKFRGLANVMPNLAWMARSDGVITWYNQRWYEYTGSTPDQPVGLGWQQAHDPQILPQVLDRWQESLASGQTFEMVFPLRGHDGTYRPFLTRAETQRDVNGEIVYWFGTCTDISRQKQVETQLAVLANQERARADFLGRLANASRELNAVLSLERIAGILAEQAQLIVDANLVVVSLIYTDGTGESIQAINRSTKFAALSVSDSLRQATQSADWQSLVGNSDAIEIPLVAHGDLTIGSMQVFDKDGGSFTADDEAVLIQLSTIATASIENARLYESLREQEQRKDEFLATLAHELRNPLAPIRNGLSVLEIEADIDRPSIIEMMQRQLGHLVHLVDDLLDVARVTTGKFKLQRQIVDLRSIIASSVETSRPIIDAARHRFDLQVSDAPMPIDADPTRIAQVLTNLLNNAAKYTLPGGEIALSVDIDHGQAVVTISDTGIGIPAEMLPKVFDLFTQVGAALDRSQGGLGIGLTLVRRLIEMHGGTVKAESDGLGRGSKFTFQLPLLGGNRSHGEGEVHPSTGAVPRVPPRARRILVVDDNVDGAESLALLLNFAGHTTQTVHHGLDVLPAAQDFQPEIVLLDIGLPGMNGYEIARQIRQTSQLRRTVLVAVTGWGSEGDKRQAIDAGFDHHLTKPIKQSHLDDVFDRFA